MPKCLPIFFSGVGSESIFFHSFFVIGIHKKSLLKCHKPWTKPTSYEVNHTMTNFIEAKKNTTQQSLHNAWLRHNVSLDQVRTCRHTHRQGTLFQNLSLFYSISFAFFSFTFSQEIRESFCCIEFFGAPSSPFSIGFSSFWTEWVTRLDFDGVSCGILDFLPRKLHFVIVQ